MLSPDLIASFPHVLALNERVRLEFSALADDWFAAQKVHEDAINLRAQKIALAEEGVLDVEREVLHARGELETARQFAEHSREDIVAVKGRTREKLFRLHTPPLWMRLVSPLVRKFLGGEPVRTHPYVEPFVRNIEATETRAEVSKNGFEAERERIEKGVQPVINEALKRVVGAENRLLGWAGRAVAGSREKTLEVMRLIPQRREFFADIYARQNATFLVELEHFPLFVQNTAAFKWDSLAPQHKVHWYGKRRAWIEERRAPTPEEYNDLPSEVKRLWVSDLRRRVLADFSISQ